MKAFNRTFVELKSCTLNQTHRRLTPFNRTFVELKLGSGWSFLLKVHGF